MNQKEILNLAALQIKPASNLSDTFLQIQTLLKQAFSEMGMLDCVVLPEYAFGTLREWVTAKQDSDQITEQIQSNITNLAQQHKVSFVAGSIPFRTDKNKWRNRSFVFSASGKILGSYDKSHPFRVEKQLGLEPGTLLPTFKIGDLRMAVLICSDLWYHDLVSHYAPEVDFLAVPTMTTVLNNLHIEYGQWAWQSLVSVRAKEYTIPIVSTDQASHEYAPGVFTCGGSCIADPSIRFLNSEGPNTQALRIIQDKRKQFITSQISLKAVRAYTSYRRDVGLRE